MEELNKENTKLSGYCSAGSSISVGRLSSPSDLTTTDGDRLTIKVPLAIGMLHHKYTKTSIMVYEEMGWFKKLMLRWCFGLEYRD